MKEEYFSKEYDLAVATCLIADENKAENIKLIDISRKTSIADYFVLITANSTVHARALVDNIEEGLQKKDSRVIRREVAGDGRWFVLDYGTLIVHILTSEIREHYQIEKLWTEGKNMLDMAGIQKMINPSQSKVKAKEKEKPETKGKEKEKPETKGKEKAKDKPEKKAKQKSEAKTKTKE